MHVLFFAFAAIRLDDHRCEVCCYEALYLVGLLQLICISCEAL